MSDASVADALRSSASLVVIEAPGGCGKTYQGAHYAADAATNTESRVLILTHTHAACDVFATRTAASRSRVEIRTLDSLICEIATAYHAPLNLSADVGAWSRANEDGYNRVAAKVAYLLAKKPMIANALARRYPLIICDEHQDATAAQDQFILALHEAGAQLRIFADPMQRIFGGRNAAAIEAEIKRWTNLKEQAGAFEKLDTPHRWAGTNPALGEWILNAREALRDNGQIDLRGALPNGLHIIRADNIARAPGQYQLTGEQRAPLTRRMQRLNSVLVMAAHNKTVSSLRAFFNRSIPIWEGHTRDALDELCSGVRVHNGNAIEIGKVAVGFVSSVAIGFTATGYSPQDSPHFQTAPNISAKTGKPASMRPNSLMSGLNRIVGMLGMSS